MDGAPDDEREALLQSPVSSISYLSVSPQAALERPPSLTASSLADARSQISSGTTVIRPETAELPLILQHPALDASLVAMVAACPTFWNQDVRCGGTVELLSRLAESTATACNLLACCGLRIRNLLISQGPLSR